MEILVKSGEREIDPRKPDSHPNYRAALKAAKVHEKEMHFENDAERKDYDRVVKSNPNNIPGLPPFYPPEKIRSINGVEVKPEGKFFAWGEWRKTVLRRMTEDDLYVLSLHDIDLFCHICDKITSHAISKKGSFCHKCGNHLPIHC